MTQNTELQTPGGTTGLGRIIICLDIVTFVWQFINNITEVQSFAGDDSS